MVSDVETKGYTGILQAQAASGSRLEEILSHIKQIMANDQGNGCGSLRPSHCTSKEPIILHATTNEMLGQLLDTPFSQPILIPSTSTLGRQMTSCIPIKCIQELLDHYPPSKLVSVQALSKPKIEAEYWTISEVAECLGQRVDERDGVINCLDIRPPSLCRNAAVAEALFREDLLRKSIPGQAHIGRGESMGGKALAEFYIASAAGSASAPHMDSDGLCTSVTVIQGSKLWLWSQSSGASDGRADTDPDGPSGSSVRCWSWIELRVGDTLLMPPGLEHAVYTPEDCLCVGGFSLPRCHLARSMQIWAHLWQNGHETNDHPSWSILELYSTLLQDVLFAGCGSEQIETYRCALSIVDALKVGIRLDEFCSDAIERRRWRSAMKRFQTAVDGLVARDLADVDMGGVRGKKRKRATQC